MGVLTLVRALRRRLQSAGDQWVHFLAMVERTTLTHDPDLALDARRVLFKKNVTLVELEPHAYCNRTCSFCPNSTIDRLGRRIGISPKWNVATVDEKAYPCATCKQKALDGAALERMRDAIESRLSEIGVQV